MCGAPRRLGFGVSGRMSHRQPSSHCIRAVVASVGYEKSFDGACTKSTGASIAFQAYGHETAFQSSWNLGLQSSGIRGAWHLKSLNPKHQKSPPRSRKPRPRNPNLLHEADGGAAGRQEGGGRRHGVYEGSAVACC